MATATEDTATPSTITDQASGDWLPGVPIHFVQRGRHRDDCFLSEENFLAYRRWPGEAWVSGGGALHADVFEFAQKTARLASLSPGAA
jgi:hypothetical protein